MKKKISLFLILFISVLSSLAQTLPNKDKARKDIELKKNQLKNLGIETGLNGVEIEHEEGPFRYYSIGSRTYYYDHVSEQDAAYHVFKLTTPLYENGDKFILRLEINYNSYNYLSSGYRKSFGKYALRAANVSIKSYEGKELTKSKLLEELNKLSVKKGKEFEVDNKYHFTHIKNVEFEKLEQQNYKGTTLYNYKIKIVGIGAEFESSLGDFTEYEIRKVAEIEAYYNAKIGLSQGKWMFVDYSLKQDREQTKINNIKVDPILPAYESLRHKSIKELMKGPIISEDISVYSIKYLNDLKRFVIFRLNTVSRNEFIKGELLTNLFTTESGKSALNQFYNLKQTMDDYYLDSVKCYFDSNRSQIIENKSGQFNLSYSVKRDASKDLYKKAKAAGVRKDMLNVIKYSANGYCKFNLKIGLVNGKVVVLETKDPLFYNRIKYTNGGQKVTHPISE